MTPGNTRRFDSSDSRRSSGCARRGALRISPFGEIGCVLALVGLAAAVLLGTGQVDERVLSEIVLAAPSNERSHPIAEMTVAGSAGTVLFRTSFGELDGRDLQTSELLDLTGAQTTQVTALAQSEDGRIVVLGYADGTLYFCNPAGSGTRLRTARGHGQAVRDLCICSDGRFAVSAGADGLVLVWDLTNCDIVRRLEVPVGRRNTGMIAAFSPGGESLAAAARDGAICCWRMPDGRLSARMSLPGVCSLAFSRDAQRLFVSSMHTYSLHCFDASSGREEWAFRSPYGGGHYGCAVASPDGRTLAAGSLSGEIDLFDVASGELLQRVKAHDAYVSCLQYSPDGRLLYSASYDGTLAVWETQPLIGAARRI